MLTSMRFAQLNTGAHAMAAANILVLCNLFSFPLYKSCFPDSNFRLFDIENYKIIFRSEPGIAPTWNGTGTSIVMSDYGQAITLLRLLKKCFNLFVVGNIEFERVFHVLKCSMVNGFLAGFNPI